MLNKIKCLAKKAGKEVIRVALVLFYCLKDRGTPFSVKSLILGDLAYLISPFDLIPDFLPTIGFSDDFGVLVTSLALLTKSIKKVHWEKANHTLSNWFDSPNYNFH